jgi:tRNA (adenine57-N1/adenine58-N1)-methyltransferase catalytic subunit
LDKPHNKSDFFLSYFIWIVVEHMQSPFLNHDATIRDNQLAILHIRRDQTIPTILAAQPNPDLDTGYAEGVVTNTRFGSFPHSTIVGLPWGSQVRASLVDTGSRGRRLPRAPAGQKEKVEDIDDDGVDEVEPVPDYEGIKQKEAVAASSGFIHVLPPTPETWTTSLPHRTQVVYTPDYGYILHRIRARPGSVLIEAGSGSGSFTHAAARAVFDGYPESMQQFEGEATALKKDRNTGRVFSYEFHADRYVKVREEIKQHGLDSIVTVMERDVCGKGFLANSSGDMQGILPSANAIFLDLPAPWLALPHLTRQSLQDAPSPLDSHAAVHICTFSPCVEQAQRTVSALRRHGWLDIEMVDIQQQRIDIRREYTGLEYEGMRGVNAIAATVDEAVARLTEIEQRSRDFRLGETQQPSQIKKRKTIGPGNPQEASKTLFRDGKLVHRSEPELKTHTSYLVFAILPMEWTEEDEARARAKWAVSKHPQLPKGTKSQRQLKREAKRKAQVKTKSVDEGFDNRIKPPSSAEHSSVELDMNTD